MTPVTAAATSGGLFSLGFGRLRFCPVTTTAEADLFLLAAAGIRRSGHSEHTMGALRYCWYS